MKQDFVEGWLLLQIFTLKKVKRSYKKARYVSYSKKKFSSI